MHGAQQRFHILSEQLWKFLWIYFPPLFSTKVVGEIPGPSFLVTGLDVAKYGIIIVGGNQAGAEKAAWKSTDISLGVRYTCTYTSNNQRPKRFCFSAVLCVGFTWQVVKTRVTRLLGVEGRKAQDQIVFCAFRSFLVEVQTNAGYIHAMHMKRQPED